MEQLHQLVILFLLAIAVSLVCNKLKIMPMVGFLLTGVLCGPSMLGLVEDQEIINQIAELGVAMLLFTIGIELSVDALNRLKRPVFMGGSLQIGLTVAFVALACWLGGTTIQSGIFWGCLAALSSSAIVLQIFQKKGYTSTPVGRITLAILVFQDIMVAPFMLCVPLLGGALTLSLTEAIFAVCKVVAVLGGVLLAAHFGLARLMDAVMATRAREILLMTTLALCFGIATLTESLGLSFSLGAFLAGLLLARSPYSMSVVSGVLPYRDIFLSLFFISVGMMLDVGFFLSHMGTILAFTAVFIVVKFLLSLPAALMQGYPLHTAVFSGLALAQVGEFSFVLAASGLSLHLFSMEEYQLFLAASVLTMMLTPLLISLAPRISGAIVRRRKIREEAEAETSSSSCALHDHLIIVGFGISGKHLALVARESGIAYNILEMNPDTVHRYKDTEPIMHGDASQPVVLEHLGVDKARVLAIIISDPAAVRAITEEARGMNPNLFIVARTRFVTEVAPLRRLGADVVIAEEFESSIEVFSQVLSRYLVPQQNIEAFSARLRRANYRMIRRMSAGVSNLSEMVDRLPDIGVQAVRLCADSPLCGVRLCESDLRRGHGLTVVAILRDKEMIPTPDPECVLCAGDVLYLFSSTEKLLAARPLFGGSVQEGAGQQTQPA